MPRVALCFPGQGSQAAGMADGLLDLPEAGELIGAARGAGLDLVGVLAGDDDALRPTEVAQPALLFVECMLWHALSGDVDTVAVAGHSVGEYAAAVAAEAIGPADAMRLVIARGRAMSAMRAGAMCALLGLDATAAAALCEEVRRDTGEVVVVANHNAPGQMVISGSRAGIDAAAAIARDRGARRTVPLNVSGAFHSPLMAGAAEEFGAELDRVSIADPRIPVVCNADATAVRDADGLRRRLRAQLTAPVRWIECVQRMVELGADTLVEVGPGSVLTGLARRIAPDAATVSVTTRDGARRLADLVTAG